MLSGLIGKKLGMTQVGDAAGRVQAVTVIQLGPCAVTQIKTAPTDGYEAVQVTFGKKKLSRATAAERGHFAKGRGRARNRDARIPPARRGRIEARPGDRGGRRVQGRATRSTSPESPKDTATPALSSGIILPGFPGSHGTHEYFRHGGSIGNRSYPGRVRKGLRMAGQMGNETATILNLQVRRNSARR